MGIVCKKPSPSRYRPAQRSLSAKANGLPSGSSRRWPEFRNKGALPGQLKLHWLTSEVVRELVKKQGNYARFGPLAYGSRLNEIKKHRQNRALKSLMASRERPPYANCTRNYTGCLSA